MSENRKYYEKLQMSYENIKQDKQQFKRCLLQQYDFDVISSQQNRRDMWMICSNAFNERKDNPFLYKVLLHYNKYPQYYAKTINDDVNRTNTITNPELQNKLSNILRCFAKRNPYIGYCQGMNFVVNFLILMQFNQQQCFWLLIKLCEDILPNEYYSSTQAVLIDIKIIQKCLKKISPELAQKLNQISIDLSIFVFEWLVCLFTTLLPLYVYIYLESVTSNCLGLIIFRRIHLFIKSFFSTDNLIVIYNLLMQQYLQILINTAQFFLSFNKNKKIIAIDEYDFISKIKQMKLNKKQIQKLRLLESNDKKQKSNKHKIIDYKQIKCDIQWPICYTQIKMHKNLDKFLQVWVFKQDSLKIMIDYFLRKKQFDFKNPEDERDDEKKILIGRIPHLCDVKSYEYKHNVKNVELSQLHQK